LLAPVHRRQCMRKPGVTGKEPGADPAELGTTGKEPHTEEKSQARLCRESRSAGKSRASGEKNRVPTGRCPTRRCGVSSLVLLVRRSARKMWCLAMQSVAR